MPVVPAMPKPPDARIIPLDRQEPLTHAQVEQVRFGLGDTGPLAQAVLNANVPAVMKQLTIGAVSCLSSRRPNDPVIGQMVFETDTKQVRFWDGSAWVTPANASPTGSLTPFAGSSAPTGWLLCDGSSKLVADYPNLYGVIGYTYGGAGANFSLPDMRGRAPFGKDDMNGTTPQNRITTAGSGIDGTTLNSAGGNEVMSHTHDGNGTLKAAIGAVNSNTSWIGYIASTRPSSAPSTTNAYTVSGTLQAGTYTFNHYTPVYGTTSGASNNVSISPAIILNYIIKT